MSPRGYRAALLCVIASAAGAIAAERPPFSVSALQYLLDRSEYERFDYYISRYTQYHPDSSILRLMAGYRYFREAEHTARRVSAARDDRTGGVPRRYPEYLVAQRPRQLAFTYVRYDERLLRQAFRCMREAQELEPHRRDIWLGMCRMAAQAGRPDLLQEHLGLGMERFGIDSAMARQVVALSTAERAPGHDSAVVNLLRFMASTAPSGDILAELARFHERTGDHGRAAAYLEEAALVDSSNEHVLRTALDMAAARSDFAAAARLADRVACLSGRAADRDMAGLLAGVDTLFSRGIPPAHACPACRERSCVHRDFCQLLRGHAAGSPALFTGDLFCLNFALVTVARRLTGDNASYYLHKAGLLYACAMYDSAAFYNLQLLRWGQRTTGLQYAAAFNLAAEYYAAGQYLMAYLRFLDLYKYAGGGRDPGVRFGLAATCEAYGDLVQAVFHYHAVAHWRRTKYEKYFPLRRLARQRLARLRDVPMRMDAAVWLQ